MPFHAEVLFGSAMHLLVHCVMPGEPAENLATLWLWIKDKYVEFGTKVRFGTMKMTMFSAGGGAKLRGTASQIRCIGPVRSGRNCASPTYECTGRWSCA